MCVRLAVYCHRLFNCLHEETLTDPQPQIPVLNESESCVETTYLEQD